ncbi:porin [Acinetobacter lwoffii]|uniref:porin n=1 Tax=Acinetobacter lwoffii TaxID=28090 RepID=UPI00209B56F9|nr:porin [Acinetobacter lwoffii]MCO8096440.1 porin [Acinetobacter lwoffii]
MKSKILVLVLSSLMSVAYAGPVFYGEIDVSVDYLPENNSTRSDRDVWEMSSNSSYLGIKGEEKLSDRLSAVYLSEWSINADGDGTDWGQRNRFVGLKDSQWGTIKFGKHDTSVKQLSSPVDTFNNYAANKADIGSILPGENRIDNAVVYESPSLKMFNGTIKFNSLFATGEASGIKQTNGGSKVAGRGFGDSWSAAVTYDNSFLMAGLGYDKAIPSLFLGRGFLNSSDPELGVAPASADNFAAANIIRAIGRVNPLDGFFIKALIQSAEVEDALGNGVLASTIDSSDGWLIGAEYNLPNLQKWTIKGQYSQNSTSFKNASDDFNAKQIMVGGDYAFNKQVKAYGYLGYLTLDQADNKDKQSLAGLGLEYKF